METNFNSSVEMFDAGYAIPEYSIISDMELYRFKDEHYKVTPNSCAKTQNRSPDIKLVRIDELRVKQFKKRKKSC